MLFFLSKLIGFLASPINLLVLCLLAVWLFFRRGLDLLLIILALLLVFYSPLGSLLILPLEDRFPRPKLPDRVDGIIALGGAIDSHISTSRKLVELDAAADRILALIELAKRYPSAKGVYSGGAVGIFSKEAPEAVLLTPLFDQVGLPKGRILLESKSRNTYENVIFSKNLAKPKPGEIWIVITSAFHMPRAVGVFRQSGWPVIPYPVDYKTSGLQATYTFSLNTRSNLEKVELALKEWVGLVAYWLLGRTSECFPGPLLDSLFYLNAN